MAIRIPRAQALRARIPLKYGKLVRRGLTSTNVNANLAVSIRSARPRAAYQLAQTGTASRQIVQYPILVEAANCLPALQTEPRILPQRQETRFAHLLSAISHSFTEDPTANIPRLVNLLRSYDSIPSHWTHYAYADPTKEYTRNLVCEIPGVFNLMILVWTPGRASAVHDHAESHCLMKILKNSLCETRYAAPSLTRGHQALPKTSQRIHESGKVAYMADTLGLHSISNPHPSEYAVSLHLYTPPNAALRGCHIYDAKNGNRRHVLQNPYDSVKGIAQQW